MRGLVVNWFVYIGIDVGSTSNPWIYDNYISLDPRGMVGEGNGTGVQSVNVSGESVGSNGDGVNETAERNVISGQTQYAIGNDLVAG